MFLESEGFHRPAGERRENTAEIEPSTPEAIEGIRTAAEDLYLDEMSQIAIDAQLDFQEGISYFPAEYFNKNTGVADRVAQFAAKFYKIEELLVEAEFKVRDMEEVLTDADVAEIQAAYDDLSRARDDLRVEFVTGMDPEADMAMGESKVPTLEEREATRAQETFESEKARVTKIEGLAVDVVDGFMNLHHDAANQPEEVRIYLERGRELWSQVAKLQHELAQDGSENMFLLSDLTAFTDKAEQQLHDLRLALQLQQENKENGLFTEQPDPDQRWESELGITLNPSDVVEEKSSEPEIVVPPEENSREKANSDMRARVFLEIDQVKHRTRAERETAHDLLRQYQNAFDKTNRAEIADKITGFLDTIDQSMPVEQVKEADINPTEQTETSVVTNEQRRIRAAFEAAAPVDNESTSDDSEIVLDESMVTPEKLIAETVAHIEDRRENTGWFGSLLGEDEWGSPYEVLGSAKFSEVLSLAELSHAERELELDKLKIKYATFSSWIDRFAEMKQVVPQADKMRFGEVVDQYILTLDEE